MLRDSRRRSPESSRRRRAERRHSREQLAAVAGPPSTYIPAGPPGAPQYTAMIPYQPQHQPSNVSLRSRADSSTSNTSSTSSSLLNISRKPRGFGIRSFFTSSSKKKHKKKRRAFRSKNSSSSSVDSDLAYGKGYIPKSVVDSPRHAPAHGSYYDASASVLGPDGRPLTRRAQTDEEILEIGRQLSLYARAENDKDLMRAGRSRPSQVAAAVAGVAAIGKLSRHNTSDSHGARGIGSSKPNRRHDSDDSDWESASDDDGSSSDDFDAGLAYGSAQFSSTHLPQTRLSTHTTAPTIISQAPPEEIRPPNRKASAVDPAMFGPVNSLRGYINTPCGFRPGEYQRPEPIAYDAVPQSSSASIEANRLSQQPMRNVYPVPTTDPGRYETTASVISGYTQHPHESPVNFSRPAPVPIQAPKPIVPVSTRVLEARRMEEDKYREREDRERKERRKSHGPGLAEAALAGVAAATIGGAVLSSSCDKREREKEAGRAEEEREIARRRDKEARRFEEERELARKREKDARRVVEEREKEARRLSEERALADREFEKRRHRENKDDARRDDKKMQEKEKDKKRRDSVKMSNALIVDERVAEAKRKEERRRERREKQRKELEELKAQIEREKEALAKQGKEIPILAPTEPPPSSRSQKKEKEVDRSAGPVDPFQFQVDDDAFQTPQFSTPARPLTPAVMTIEREPKFDDDEPTERERMSRKDSYEKEQAYVKEWERARIHAITDEAEHSTIPVHGEVIAAVIAASNDRDRKRTRDAEPTRDPIEEANRWYREKKAAEREEETQSRSHSPEPSVLEKYKDDGTEPVTRIVTPPAMKLAHDKSKYDGPNADVRIDHVITPRELHMFRVPPTSLDPHRDSPPQWKSRDPSCERERPLLNLVRPTPEPTPTPEKQEKRGRTAARSEPEEEEKPQGSERSRSRSRSPSRSRDRSPSPSVVIGPRGEIRQAPPDTPTSKSVTWGENDTKHYNPASPDRTAEEREAAEKLKQVLGNKKKPGSGWGDLAAAFAAAAASGTLPGMSSKPDAREETKRESRSVQEERQKKERSPSPPSRKTDPRRPSVVTTSPPRSRSIIDDHDQPPQPGPKPPSPSHHTSQKQMPGAFADDLDFTAHVAAGLQSSGFDPDIVIEDPQFRRRDSPPGSNVTNGSSKAHEKQASPPSSSKIPYQRPFAETVTDLGIVDEPVAHTKPRERAVDTPDTPASEKAQEDEWESSKKSKKSGKKSKRNTIDLADSDPIIVTEERAPEPDFERVLSKKEQKKREKKTDRFRDFDDESSTAREPDVVVAEAREADWAPKLSKKEQKKRERAARDEGSSTPRETEPESVTAEPPDEWKEEKGKKGKKGKKADQWEDEPAPESRSVVDVPEDDWADAKAGKKDEKKKKRASLKEEDLPTSREADFETVVAEPRDDEWADAKSAKKDKKKRDKAAREEESFTSGVLVSEPAPLEGSRDDEWEEPKSSKKDKKGKKNRKSGSAWDEVEDAAPSDDPSVSVPVDAFSDLQRSAVSAQDDEWDTPSKKSKKKSNRVSTYDNYDSPSRSVAPSEISVESSSKKDKKSKRDSTYDTYDSPSRSVAPSEVSVETSSKKDKKSKRKSTKDSYDRPDEGEPPDKRRDSFKPIDRDVDSLVSEPTKYGSKSNGNWADEVEEAESQSVVSAPPSSDRKDRSKKRSSKDEKSTKEEKRLSGSGFFGLFKGTNGGETAAKKDSHNNDKQSFLGNAGILGAGAGLAGAALLTSALSGAEEEKEEGDARPNATRGTSGKEDQTTPTTTRAVDAERSVTPPGRARSISLGSQLVDPEIVQRAIKPAIDPQYGDLLPLPPSLPGSPGREVDMEFEEEELPALPESRPDTPPAQQQQERAGLSTTKTHVRRRSAFETPTKSPSQTAIPIHFRLGQRSVPPSPAIGRSSPIHSPSTPVPEMGSVPKPRSRPNSWGRQMLGEPKPLYLVEKASSGSLSTDFEDRPYPALPPSEPASTAESPAPEFEHREGFVDYLSLAPQSEMNDHERGQALRLDTALAALNPDVEEPLGSAELTPKAEKAATVDEFHSPRRQSIGGSVSMDDSFHSAAQSPVYNRRDSFGLATGDVEVPGGFPETPGVGLAIEEPELGMLGEQTPRKSSPVAEVHREEVDDFPELPPLPESSGASLVDEPLLSREQEFLELVPEETRPAAVEAEPAPVEPMTKDRSSYLLQQTPPSTKTLDNVGIRDRSPSPSPDRKRADKEGSDLDIATGVAAGLFGSGVVAALMHEGRSSPTPKGLESVSEEAEKTMSGSKPDSPSGSIKSAEDLLTPDEFSFIPTRKGKKGKKGRKGKEVESPAEPEPIAERAPAAEEQAVPETEMVSEKQASSEPPPSQQQLETPLQEDFATPPQEQLETPAQEDFATPAEEQLETPALEEFATPLPIPSSIQTSQDQGDHFFEPASSKKSKKKQKKALARDLPAEEAPLTEAPSAIEEPTEVTPAPLSRSTSVSSKKGKKKKGKQAFAWEPEEPAIEATTSDPSAEDLAQSSQQHHASLSDGGPSLSQEQTLVAEPSQSTHPDIPQLEEKGDVVPQALPEVDPLSEWAITSAKKGKKGKKDKKGKKTPYWDDVETPGDDLPGAFPETPAAEIKQPEASVPDVPAVTSPDVTLVDHDQVVAEAVERTLAEAETKAEAPSELQEPAPQAAETVGTETTPEDEPQSRPASEWAFAPANKDKQADVEEPPVDAIPGALPETPATEVKEPEGFAHVVPGTTSQEETLAERQQPVPKAAGPSAAGEAEEPEAVPEPEWDFKPAKKGKKGKKGKKAQLWEAEEAPADDLPPALPAVSSLVDDVAVPLPKEDPVTKEEDPVTKDEAVSTDTPTDKPEMDPEPDAWEPTAKKGKKGKKSKKQALAWEAEDSAEAGKSLTPSDNNTPAELSHIIQNEELPTHGLAGAFDAESKRSNEMQLVEPALNSTQATAKKGKKGKKTKRSQFAWEPEEQSAEQSLTESTALEETSTTPQPSPTESSTMQEQPTVSGSSTISEPAPVSHEPTASQDIPHLEIALRPAPLEQPVTPSSPRQVPEQSFQPSTPSTPSKTMEAAGVQLTDAINTPLPDEASGDDFLDAAMASQPPSVTARELSATGKAENQITSEAPRSPTVKPVEEQPAEATNKGIVTSALSIIPSVATVGGLLGFGKGKQEEQEANPKTDNTVSPPQESTSDPATQQTHDLSSVEEPPAEHPTDERSEQGPNVTGPTADMQPLAPANESGQATHNEVAVADTATVLIPDEQVSPHQDESRSTIVHDSVSEVTQHADNTTKDLAQPSTQAALDQQDKPIVTDEQDLAVDEAQPSDTMDWELETGSAKKKGKKGKKGRGKVQGDAGFEPEASPAAQDPSASPDSQDATRDASSDDKANLARDAPVDATPDDEWAVTSKKGKKNKKNRKSQPTFDLAEPDTISDSSTSAQPELPASDIPLAIPEESPEPGGPSEASRDTPVDVEPVEPSAENFWSEPTPKKGKKNKKSRKSQSAFDVLDTEPSGTSTPLQSTESTETPVIPAETEDQPSLLEAPTDIPTDAPEEPAAEDVWAEPTSKKGKKGKKSKKQSAQDWEPEPITPEERSIPTPAAEAQLPETHESSQPEEPATTGVEATADDIWSEPTIKKGKKDKKKKKGASKTSSGTATPAFEETPLASEAPAAQGPPAPTEESERDNSPTQSDPAPSQVSDEQAVTVSVPSHEEPSILEAPVLQDPSVVTEDLPETEQLPDPKHAQVVEEQPPAARCLLENISTTPANLDENLTTAAPAEITEPADTAEHVETTDPAASTEPAEATDPGEAADALAEQLPELSQTAAAAVIDDLTSGLRETGDTHDPDIDVAGGSQEQSPKEMIEPAAEDIWEQPASGKKGKKGKKNKRSTPEFDLKQLETPQEQPGGSIQAEPSQDIPADDSAAQSDNRPAEATVEDTWEEPSAKKGKKGKKKKAKAQSFSWDEPSQDVIGESPALNTATESSARGIVPEQTQEEPALALSTSPPQLPSGDLNETQVESITLATEATSNPPTEAEPVEDDFWPTSKKKGKGKKPFKGLDALEPESAPEDKGTPSQGSEAPAAGETSVAPSSDESGSPKNDKKAKNKRRVSWVLPGEEPASAPADPEIPSGEVSGAADMLVLPDDLQAASSSEPATQEEVEVSKGLLPVDQQDSALETREVPVQDVAPSPSEDTVVEAAKAPVEEQVAETIAAPTEPEPASPVFNRPLDEPSVPAPDNAQPQLVGEPQDQETVADSSSTPAILESRATEVTEHLQDEPTPIPQPFEEDLSALLPTSPYSVSLRKSKKDKKKRSSLIEPSEPPTPTTDDNDQPGNPVNSTSKDLPSTPEAASTDLQPLEEVLDLPQSFTLKRSKKDKKKGKKQAMPWDDSESTSDNSPSESWSTPPLAVTQLSTIMEASTEDLPGSDVGAKRHQDVAVTKELPTIAVEEKQIPEISHDTGVVDLPAEEHQVAETLPESPATDAPKRYESDTSQKTEKAAPSVEDVPAPPPVETPVETPVEDGSSFSWSTKKDKKGKKGKKSKSVQPEPTAPEETESTPQEDINTSRSIEKPQQLEAKEDDFTTPSSGKKGKKVKKNKLSAFSWDEPEPESIAEAGSAGDEPAAEKKLLLEAEPVVENPLAKNEPETETEAPLLDPQPDVVAALPTESLSTEPPPLDPLPTEPRPPETLQTEVVSTEPLANEKEQHLGGSSIEMQEVPAAHPGEVNAVEVPENESQQPTEPLPQPDFATLQEQVEDEWAVPVKKSKKGKKGKSAKFTDSGTPSGTSTPLVEEAPVELSGTSTSRDIAAEASPDDLKAIDVAAEPTLAESSQAETHADDIWAVTSSKKSKKDKKKKGSKASDSEPPSGTLTPIQETVDVSSALPKDSSVVGNLEPAEAHVIVEEPAAETEVATEALGAGSEETSESQPTKKSKKDKKRKGSKLAELETPAEPSVPALVEELDARDVESLPQAEASEHVEVDVQPPAAVEAEPEATVEEQREAEDLWPVSGKKSKKDKKRKGSKFAGEDATSGTASPVIQDEPAARQLDTAAEPRSTADLPQDDTAQANENWATTSSKKAKKGKGKQAAAGLLAGAAAIGVLSSVGEPKADQIDKEVEPSQEVLEAVNREVEPDSFWETPAKKSKKDKKGKKNASRSASGTATPAKEEETALASSVPLDDFQVKEPSAETAAEQDDFQEFSTKKLRKDKKTKGKQVDLTDFAETSPPPRDSVTAISDVEVQKAEDPDSLDKDGNRLQSKSSQPPAEASASKIEINPAVLEALRLSPDHGLRAILPHVETTGSIEPHVLYAIDTPSPKLLTGSPPPKELLVCPPEGETTEGIRDLGMTESSHVSHSPPFDTLSQRKRTKTLESDDVGAAETVNPLRDTAAATSDFKSQEPTETELRDEVKVTQRERSLSTASRTSSRKEARDKAASYLAEQSAEAPPDKPITEEPAVIEAKSEPSARDIAAAVLEVGPKTLLMTEDKHAAKDCEVTSTKVQDPPSPEARRLAASWLEHEHEHHHHESPAEADRSVSGLEVRQHDIAEDEAAKPTSSRDSASDDPPMVQATSSKKKSKRGNSDARDTEVVATAGALAGGVALLADKFGGSKKKKGKKKSIDKRTAREDDMFDDPALWEGADRRPVEGSRMDENADGFWDVPDEVEEQPREMQVEDKKDSNVVMNDGPAKKDKDVVMGGTDEREVLRLRNITEQAAGDYVESPTLGRRASERKREAERRSKGPQEDETADIEPVQRAFSFPEDIAHEDVSSPVAAAPTVQRQFVEDNIDDYSPIRSVHHVPSITDFRRSVPSLPPVQEDWAEETEPDKHQARHLTRTPEVNRDSGFMSDSPASLRRSHQFEDDSHRDSGVHMKDWPESTPPRARDPRGFEAHPPRTSGSSLKETQSYDQYETPDRHQTTKRSLEASKDTPSRALGFTPKLREPSPPQRTPEPQKSLAKTRTTRQLDNEPTPERHGGASLTPVISERRVVSDNSALRQYSKSPHTPTETSAMAARRSASNTSITRHRTPEPLVFRPDTPGSIRSLHSATPPLRRVDKRVSGDLRSVSLSQRSVSDLSATANKIGDKDKDSKDAATAAAALGIAAGAGAAALALAAATNSRASQNTTPVANEGRVRTKDMADVYDGYGEGRIGSPRSPTRPHSMRRRQSMQVLDLENKVKELEAENQALSSARVQVEQTASQRASMALAQRDAEIDTLKQNIAFLQKEVDRLTEVNEGLSSANAQIAVTHTERYRRLESQHAEAARELEQTRGAHSQLQQKDAEIASLRAQLEDAKEKIRSMQEQILASSSTSAPDFLRVRDVDHFDHRCQQLCSHVQQWVLRFSKFSDMRACRLTSEINDEKIIDRLDNAVLDGSDVDAYLSDRVRRRDIFMSMTMTMIWEFVFTRYLFGMDREQRQKLKSLEKILLEVGPPHAVRQWRAITLTLLASRPQFKSQRDTDTEAVVQAVFQTLSVILPPPTNMEDQIQSQLRKVMREAVDLAIEMRTQRAEYMMLPPLQPEYDDTGELTETVSFNASLMNERSSGSSSTNEELEAALSIVRIVLFPLVVKKGDDEGKGDDEVVVSPAQVLVAKPFKEKTRSIRMVTPSSDAGGASLFARSSVAGGSPAGTVMGAHGRNGSNVSMANTEGEFI